MIKIKNNAARKLTYVTLLIGVFLCCTSSSAIAREMIAYPWVKIQSLDKATARTMTFEAKVGSTLKFGPLYMKVLSCQRSSPVDLPEAAAFLQIWEPGNEKESKWVFSGWMFASSPALSPMDHAIYDVWVVDCFDKQAKDNEKESKADQNDQGDMLQ